MTEEVATEIEELCNCKVHYVAVSPFWASVETRHNPHQMRPAAKYI